MIKNIAKLAFQNQFLSSPQNKIFQPLFRFSTGNGLDSVKPQLLDQQQGIDQKIKVLEDQQPFFDRLIYFDPDVMANLPGPLARFDPIVENVKDFLVNMHDFGIPWLGVISLTCLMCRTTLLPLIYLQIQRANRLTAISPVIIQLKKLTDQSTLPKYEKWGLFLKGSFSIVRLFVYNMCHIPLMVTMVWGIRRLLIEESVKNTSLLWIPSLSGIDPYYVVPFMTVGCYYYNFQRFITPENKHTFISKLRNVGQVFLILWLPLLCNWPSAIVWYMFSNAVISILQTTLLITPQFLRMVEPKMLLYQYLLKIVEYDKTQSETLIETIKNGEESFNDKAISEDVLVFQTEQMLKKLNAEIYDDIQQKQENEEDAQKQQFQSQELKF